MFGKVIATITFVFLSMAANEIKIERVQANRHRPTKDTSRVYFTTQFSGQELVIKTKLTPENQEIIDDQTEEFLKGHKIFFLAFGIVFGWMVIKSLGISSRK